MSKKIIRIDFPINEINSLLEWYRVSHHGGRCNKRLRSCHRAKKRILTAIKEEFGEKKYIY